MARTFAVVVLGILSLAPRASSDPDPVTVRYSEGLVHGFLSLRSPTGDLLANGDLIQTAQGDRVSTRLVFHFIDGSLHDETAVYSQRGAFHLLRDHLVQRGPAFDHSLDMTIDAATALVSVRYQKDDDEKVVSEKMALPAALGNGMVITLLKNIRPDNVPVRIPFLAATPKPRLVTLVVTSGGTDAFSTASAKRVATHFVVRVSIGGIAGALAPIFGRQPPDSHVWILQGEAPAFVKSEATLSVGGPVFRTELVSPVWK